MKVNLTTPANLVGQRAEDQFDAYWLANSSKPSGPLGSTLTLDASLQKQAIELGFEVTGYEYG